MERLIENLVPVVIVVIVVINVIRGLIKGQSKQTWRETQRVKQYPRMPEVPVPTATTRPPAPTEEWGETEEVEPIFMPETVRAEYPDTGVEARQPAQRETAFEPVVREQPEQEPTVVWQPQVEEFLRRIRERMEVPQPPVFEQPRPRLEKVPEIPRIIEEVPQPEVAEAAKPPRPVRKRRMPVSARIPAQIFGNLDDVRRGIIMSEILGPPIGLR